MAYGARDRRGAEASGWLGTGMIALYALALGCALYVFDTPIARLYTHDPDLLASAAIAIAICGFILLPDGLQGVLMGALRGLGDVNWPSVMHLFSFWAVAVPLAHHLAFTRGWGTDGLLWGLMAGLVVAASLLAIRFAFVSRRLIPASLSAGA